VRKVLSWKRVPDRPPRAASWGSIHDRTPRCVTLSRLKPLPRCCARAYPQTVTGTSRIGERHPRRSGGNPIHDGVGPDAAPGNPCVSIVPTNRGLPICRRARPAPLWRQSAPRRCRTGRCPRESMRLHRPHEPPATDCRPRPAPLWRQSVRRRCRTVRCRKESMRLHRTHESHPTARNRCGVGSTPERRRWRSPTASLVS